MRRSIATRMSPSRTELPHIYLHRSLDATRLVALRSEINSVLAERGEHLTINDFILKACGLTLQQVPKARHIWADDHILDRGTCDVGVAIATRDSVVSPVVQDVDHKPITQISQEMRALRAQVDSGSPISSEAERSSLTLSNLGPHGVESFDAIITAPQSAVLAVGAIVQKPMVTSDGSVRSAPMMALTLGLDHRVLDGADGAAFLAHLVRLLEAPGALVI
jgi:pyruvate dehydrogenase E2 component (dihydrolipoamide acetyltransferase)